MISRWSKKFEYFYDLCNELNLKLYNKYLFRWISRNSNLYSFQLRRRIIMITRLFSIINRRIVIPHYKIFSCFKLLSYDVSGIHINSSNFLCFNPSTRHYHSVIETWTLDETVQLICEIFYISLLFYSLKMIGMRPSQTRW